MKKLNRILSLLIALVMVIGLLPTAALAVVAEESIDLSGVNSADYAAAVRENAPYLASDEGVTVNKIANPGVDLHNADQGVDKLEIANHEDDEIVRVIVVLKDKPLLSQGFTVDQISGGSAAAASAVSTIEARQDTVVAEINKVVRGLGIQGVSAEITAKYRYSVAVNGLAVEVPYGALDAIRALDGVEAAFVAPQYDVPEDAGSDTMQPYTNATCENFGSAQTWEELGYTGQGMRIAIVDTGIDTDHPSFADAPEGASLTVEEIDSVLQSLNAYYIYGGLTADELYVNEKIPFAFNYVDGDLDVTHDNDYAGDHGSHVAGIAAANKIDTTSVVGVAPDAQIIVMKVFGKNGGAYGDDILAALEDCMRLGVDVVNMSLGSPAAFTDPEGGAYLDYYLSEIEECGMILSVAAGNEYSAPYGSPLGQELGLFFRNFTTDPDNGIVGGPSTSSSAISVASWENTSYMTNYIMLGETEIVYYDATYVFAAVMAPEEATEYEYVMIPGLGNVEDFEGIDVEGKIAVIQRGTIAFTDKQQNAAAAGAVACIVYDNVYSEDPVYMQDSGALPNVFISRADGEALAAAVDPETGVGKLTVMTADDVVSVPSPTAGQMSDFSSWGVSPDLELLPEVTAPGGNIYSCYTDGQYGMMSGTSMAAPHIAGMSALVLQYLSDTYGLTGEQARTVADALIMSTAVPVVEPDTGNPYSPRKQGAGLANVYSAVTSPVYLTVDGSTPKVSLGDDDKRTGRYTLTFEVNNMSDEDVIYALDSSVLTDYVTYYYAFFMGEMSLELDAEVQYSFIGSDNTFKGYDVNKDGVFDAADVQFALDVANGVEKAAIADVNGDGVFNTADAQYLLEMLAVLPDAETSSIITVPAGETVVITASIKLTDDDKEYMDYFYPNGIYVDGFIRLLAMSEGAVDLSLPFVGFYGDWSDAKVFDSTWYYEDDEIPERYWNVLFTNFYDQESSFNLGLNPYLNEEYDPAHNVLSPNGDGYQDCIDDMYLALMRNAKTIDFTWVNEYGLPVYASSAEYVRKSYYISAYGLMLPFIYSSYVDGYYDYSGMTNGDRVTLYIEAYLDDGDNLVDETLAIPIVIDTEAPELEGYELVYDAETDTRILRLTVSDNYDVAAVIPLTTMGSPYEYFAVNAKEEGDEGETAVIEIDVSSYDNSFVIAVCDYGCNESYYEITFEGKNAINFDKFYGYRNTSVVPYGNYLIATTAYNGWHSFSEPDSLAMHTSARDEIQVAAAEYIDGYVIGVDVNGTIFANKAGDWSNRTIVGTLKLGGDIYTALDMAFDYTTKTLYILTDELSSGYGCHLVAMDYLTGDLTDLGTISMGYGSQPLTLACDNNGVLYTVNFSEWAANGYESGALYTISVEYDEEWDETYVTTEKVGDTGYVPAYYQSMTVDHETNKLYWAAYQGYTGDSILFEVDKTTGELTVVDAIEYNSELTALFKPFKAPEALYPTEPVELEGVALSESSLTMAVGRQEQLISRPVPYYAEITGTVHWSSSDEAVAVVDQDGVITAVGAGYATITAELDGETVECAVRVVNIDADLYVYDAGMEYVWLNFNANDPESAEELWSGIQPNGAYDAFIAATYTVDGTVYAYDTAGGFYKIDAETMEGIRLGTNTNVNGTGGYMLAMTFSPADGHLYGIAQTGSFWEMYYSLVRINPSNGEFETLADLSDYAPVNLAVAPDGTFYCVADVYDYITYKSYTAVLSFELNEFDEPELLDVIPVQGYESGYGNYHSLVYSAENEGLFWADYNGQLVWIDPTTGENVTLGNVGITANYYPTNVGLFEVPAEDPDVHFAVPESVTMPASFLLLEGGSTSSNVVLAPWNARATLEYSVDDENVASVDETGMITGIMEGTTTLTVHVVETDETLNATITVVPSAGYLYGNVITDLMSGSGNFWVEIPDIDPTYAEGTYDGSDDDFSPFSGAYYNGYVYAYCQDQLGALNYRNYLVKYDVNNYSSEVIGQVHETIRDMDFDYTTGTMYAVVQGGAYTGALAQVNLETAQVCVIGDTGHVMAAMTVDGAGRIYAISEDGNLYQISKETGAATLVGATGVTNISLFQSMHYDPNTGNTYWAQVARDYTNGLYLVDLGTGAATSLGTVGTGAEVGALYTIPETEPEVPETVEATGVALTEKTAVVVGETVELQATILPISVANVTGELTWTTSDPAVATVDENGVVTGVGAGKATISASVGVYSASCVVTVTAEARRFYVYDKSNAQWISFLGEDTSDVRVERADAEDESKIQAACYTGEVLYAYDVDGIFYTIDLNTFERTEVGQLSDVEYLAYNEWRDMYYTNTLYAENLYVVDMSYDNGVLYAVLCDGYDSVICTVNVADGSVEFLYLAETRPANLLVEDGRAYFVDCYISGILTYVDLYAAEHTEVQAALVPGYWGDNNTSIGLIRDEATGVVYTIRDMTDGGSKWVYDYENNTYIETPWDGVTGNATLYTLNLSDADIAELGVIGDGTLVVNSLFIR
ncbi:MAG: S8 family serine peptidase [Candidatus Enterenecus sp.]